MDLKPKTTLRRAFAGNSKMFLMFLTSFFLMGLPAHIPAAKNTGAQTPCNTISANALQQRLQKGQDMVIVDVRNSKEFQKVHIAGSINIALHFLKTKAFLKSKPFVLVGGGYPDSQMEAECRALQTKGFKASILGGGMITWHRRGFPVQGDLLYLQRYKNISPLIFNHEKDRKNQIIINVSQHQSQASKKLVPSAIHISLSHDPRDWGLLLSGGPDPSKGAGSAEGNKILKLSGLRVSAVNQKSFLPVLVFNETGEHYEQVETIMKQAGLTDLFYLEGGLNGYKRYLNHLALSRQPRASRIKTTSKCPSCGQQKVKEQSR